VGLPRFRPPVTGDTFDAEAGDLLEFAVDEDGFFSFELTNDSGRFVGFDDIGIWPDEVFWGEGRSDRAWFVLDRDGSYQLSDRARRRHDHHRCQR
jgi:hypothetical protein